MERNYEAIGNRQEAIGNGKKDYCLMPNDYSLIKHYDNPAKRFLRGYRAMMIRRESLLMEIERRRESATGTTVRLKPIMVSNGSAAYDRMAEDVARIVDAEEALTAEIAEISKRLTEILDAIRSVQDEMQKTVLTLRYIDGLDWLAISERIGYEISNTYIIHGRALVGINDWLKRMNHE